MEIARLLSTTVIGRKLHGTDAGTLLALHLACGSNVHSGIGFGQRLTLWSDPRGEGAHGTERAPCTRCIDERESDAYDGGHHNDGPEHATDTTPHSQAALTPGNGECELNAKHAKDEKHHEETETKRAHENGNRFVGRILRQQAVV